MDSEYLEKTLGKDLTDCLAEVCLKRPADPIEYIALWMYKRDATLKFEAQEAIEKAELQNIMQEHQQERERLERIYLENLRLEEEEKERLRLLEMENERLRQMEEKQKVVEDQKEKEEVKTEEVDADSTIIEIGIKTHDKDEIENDKIEDILLE